MLDEPAQKKRKLSGAGDSDEETSRPHASTTNDVQYARLSSQVRANQHIVKLHEIVKKECDQIISLIVSHSTSNKHPVESYLRIK